MVELARIQSGAADLPHRVVGIEWRATVAPLAPAWLLRATRVTNRAALPGPTNARIEGERVLGWLSPDAWLLLGTPGDVDRASGAWFDASARYLALSIGGNGAGFAARQTGIDPASLVPGRSLPTRLAGQAVQVLPLPDRMLIAVERARASYWIDWLAAVRAA